MWTVGAKKKKTFDWNSEQQDVVLLDWQFVYYKMKIHRSHDRKWLELAPFIPNANKADSDLIAEKLSMLLCFFPDKENAYTCFCNSHKNLADYHGTERRIILSTNPTQKGDNRKLTTNNGDKGKPTAELWKSLFKKREHPKAVAD